MTPRLLRLAPAALALLLAAASTLAAPTFEDTIAARTRACTACHGEQGKAGPDGYYPRLAGKPAGYLFNQLVNFRDGRRHYGLMTRLVDPLSDAYLMEIARHFSSLDLPYPAPAPATAPPAVLARGRTLALQGNPAARVPACTACHGSALTGVLPATPGLVGLPLDYLNAQLGAWQTRQRRAHAPDCMAEIVQRLEPADLAAVAAWLAAQPVPAPHHPAAARPATEADLPRCGSAPAGNGGRP